MFTPRTKVTAVLLLVVALVAAGVVPQRIAAQGDDPVPPDVAANLTGWALPNYDYSNTRASTGSDINASNVATLGQAWTYAINGGSDYGAAATNPVVLDGIVYFQDLSSNVYAVSMDEGSEIWRTELNVPNIGPNGVAVGYDKVFAVLPDSVVALSTSDGSTVWSTTVRTQNDSEGVTIQPLVWNGMVYLSTVPGSASDNFYSGGVGGILYALNQETGEIVWGWDTVDSEDLWGNPDINSGGGAWYPPAIDQDTGQIYFSVANPAPWPGTEEFPNGSSRPGDNLYSNSLVALDAAAGTLTWYNQVRPHDLFDLDLQISPILGTATINGEERSVVFTSGKLGRVYAMERTTGELLWNVAVGVHKNDDILEVPEGQTIEVGPGPLGGVETPMALADGMLYVPIVNMPVRYSATALDGESFDLSKATGELVAIDVNTGAVLWDKSYSTMNIGAATVVNDLVFTATMDGMIYAYDRSSGDEVWSYQAPAGINGWPAVVGDTIVWPAGMGETPVLLALKLGMTEPGAATIPSATEAATDGMATQEAAATETSADTSGLDGEALVQERCTTCHTAERIDNASKTAEEWAVTVDRMISYGAQLNDAERQAVIDYLAATHGPDSGGDSGGFTGP